MRLRAEEQVTEHAGGDNEGQEDHRCDGQAHQSTNAEPPHVAVLVGEEAVRVVAAVLVVAEAAAEDGGRLAPRPRAAEAAHLLLLGAHVARAGAAHRARRRRPGRRGRRERGAGGPGAQKGGDPEGQRPREAERRAEAGARPGAGRGDGAGRDPEAPGTQSGRQIGCLSKLDLKQFKLLDICYFTISQLERNSFSNNGRV